MYMIFHRWNSKIRLSSRKEWIDWTPVSRWPNEEAAIHHIQLLLKEKGKWQFQYKVMKVIDLDPVKIYGYEAEGGPLQIVEVESNRNLDHKP